MFPKGHWRSQSSALALITFVAFCVCATFALAQTQHPSDCFAYASIPLPSQAQKTPVPKTAPSCASYRSYRGIGRPVDYSEARRCAWQERLSQQADLGQSEQEPLAWMVGGSLILTDIYFNGAGVKRNVALAMRFACEYDEGMAKLMLRDIDKKFDTPADGSFEFCDFGLTTMTMNFCAGYRSQIDDDRRTRYYNSLKPSMTSEQSQAFEKLLSAKDAYIKAHMSEVDQGGSIRGLRTIGSENILKDLFRTHVIHFERKKWPTLSDTQIKGADNLLHREYKKTLQRLRNRPKNETYEGAVTAGNLSRVQEAWQGYRNAWVAFARLRYPGEVEAIGASITLDRYPLLKTIY